MPEQSRTDIAIFKDILSKLDGDRLKIFEWGSGASTIYYPEYLRSIGRPFDWYAVDNSEEWFQVGKQKISEAELTEQVQIFCFDFPSFWQLPGYSYGDPVPPLSYMENPNIDKYVNCPKSIMGSFDLMFVDGRFRRRCLEVAAELLTPQGIAILHDANRLHYHSSLSLFPHVEFKKTGLLPGQSQRSDVALCTFNSNSLIEGVS